MLWSINVQYKEEEIHEKKKPSLAGIKRVNGQSNSSQLHAGDAHVQVFSEVASTCPEV